MKSKGVTRVSGRKKDQCGWPWPPNETWAEGRESCEMADGRELMNGGGWSVETWDQSRGQTGDLERGTAHTQRPETSDTSDTAATSLPASVIPCLACKPGRARPTLALRASQKPGQFGQSNVMGGPPFPSLGWPLALRKRGKDAFRGHRSSTRQAQVSDISRFASLQPFNLNQRFFSLNTPRTLVADVSYAENLSTVPRQVTGRHCQHV